MTEKKMASVMFADIVGYSKMMGLNQTKMLNMLEQCQKTIEPIVEQFHGKKIKWIGDEIFCEFPLNENAADCALEIQKILYNMYTDDKKFRIALRIGIHAGEIAVTEDDRYGNTVNVAARIEKQAPKGGIAISGGVYSELKSYPRYKFKKLPSRKLKNINFKHELYSICTGYEIRSGKSYYFLAALFVCIASAVILFYPMDVLKLVSEKSADISQGTGNLSGAAEPATAFANRLSVKRFLNGVLATKTPDELLKYLDDLSKNGIIKVGNKKDFYNPDEKVIILLGEMKINDVLLTINNRFVSLIDKREFTSLTESYRNQRMIWVHVY